jgi:hypothetical protein
MIPVLRQYRRNPWIVASCMIVGSAVIRTACEGQKEDTKDESKKDDSPKSENSGSNNNNTTPWKLTASSLYRQGPCSFQWQDVDRCLVDSRIPNNPSKRKCSDNIGGFMECATKFSGFYDKRYNYLQSQLSNSINETNVMIEDVNDLPPTGCSICIVNREGPCGNHWAQVERILKENIDSKSSDAPPSDNLREMITNHYLCLNDNFGFYAQLDMASRQPYIDETEQSIRSDKDFQRPIQWVGMEFDWSYYRLYTQNTSSYHVEEGTDQTYHDNNNEIIDEPSEDIAVNSLDSPTLIPVVAIFQIQDADKEKYTLLEYYARDDRGTILGHNMNTKDSDKTKDDDKTDSDSDKTFRLTMYIDPETSRHFRLYKIMTDKENGKQYLFESDLMDIMHYANLDDSITTEE